MVHEYAVRTPERRPPVVPRSAGARSRIVELQRLAGNRAVTGLLAPSVQRDDADDIYDEPPPERVTGYLGMNPEARKEATGLGTRRARRCSSR
jgi:hypothetical protein